MGKILNKWRLKDLHYKLFDNMSTWESVQYLSVVSKNDGRSIVPQF